MCSDGEGDGVRVRELIIEANGENPIMLSRVARNPA